MPTAPALEDRKINTSVRTAIAICVTIVGAAVCATSWTSGILNGIRNDNQTTLSQLRELSTTVADVKAQSLTLPRASEIALRAAIENPSLRVPDPRNPEQIISAHRGQ